jgi:CRISPR system Cascade subunit CasB
MTEVHDRARKFINYLLSLVREGADDRGALADLRSGLAFDPGQAPRMFRHVVPHLGERETRDDRWFYVVGAMFGANPKHVSGSTVGRSFRALKDQGSDSIEARFVALLAAHPDDLHSHLFHATGLLKSKDFGLDYYVLLKDLMDWDREDRSVQNRWARAYYRKSTNNDKGENEGE